jgi:hypothetical protein
MEEPPNPRRTIFWLPKFDLATPDDGLAALRKDSALYQGTTLVVPFNASDDEGF